MRNFVIGVVLGVFIAQLSVLLAGVVVAVAVPAKIMLGLAQTSYLGFSVIDVLTVCLPLLLRF